MIHNFISRHHLVNIVVFSFIGKFLQKLMPFPSVSAGLVCEHAQHSCLLFIQVYEGIGIIQ